MTRRTVVLTELEERVTAAFFEDDRLTDLYFPDPEERYRIGSIYPGRVKKLVKPLQAAFVDLEPGVTGFLPLERLDAVSFSGTGAETELRPEQVIPVQIVKEASKSKDMVLTRQLSLSGKYFVLTAGKEGVGVSRKIRDPGRREELRAMALSLPEEEGEADSGPDRSFGLIVRTNAAQASEEELRQDYRSLREQYQKILDRARTRTEGSALFLMPEDYLTAIRDLPEPCDRIVTDLPEYYDRIRDSFDTDPDLRERIFLYRDELLPLRKLWRLEAELDRALSRHVWLPSGGSLILEITEALTVIDVNTGKSSAGKGGRGSILRTNLEAAAEAARQIRLRNYSGIILIDFINMTEERDRKQVGDELRARFQRDPVKTEFLGFTRLELAEIVREKKHPPLHEVIRRNLRK